MQIMHASPIGILLGCIRYHRPSTPEARKSRRFTERIG